MNLLKEKKNAAHMHSEFCLAVKQNETMLCSGNLEFKSIILNKIIQSQKNTSLIYSLIHKCRLKTLIYIK